MSTPDDIVYHRQVKSHTGMVWECHGDPDDAVVSRETERLVAAGGVVVTRPESPQKMTEFEAEDRVMSILFFLSNGIFLLLLAFVVGRAVLDKMLPSAWDAGWHVATAGAAAIIAGGVALVVFSIFLGALFHSVALGGIPRHMR